MSLSFKYWVEFDDEGDIKELHKSKYSCESECKEYLVKLIPIERDITDDAEKMSREVERESNKLRGAIKKFDTELTRTLKEMKRIKLN